MSISIRQLPDLQERAELLGCDIPEGICVFPRNFEVVETVDNLEYDDFAQTVKKLLQQAGLNSHGLKLANNKYLQQRENLPAICLFVGWTISTQDPTSVQLAINVIGNYLTDLFKGLRSEREQKCTFKIIRQRIKGKTQEFDELTYTGPISGIPSLIEKLNDGSK
ncbi:MAG: hypothetical protein K2X81_08165 [Candidatus Obscuribacterales bacterium]|nr:hypothetical protein [Candidatus Obscuribacterales bacterium]